MIKRKYYLITLLILIADFIAKRIADAKLYPRAPFEIIPGYLRLSYVHNSGVAFGFFDEIQSGWKPYVLGALAVIAIAIILVYSTRLSGNRKLLHVALAITMGGILGNLIDRISYGYVVDFIEFHLHETFHWPTFNIADSAISIGIVLLLIDTVRGSEKQWAVGSGQ
jgi:signal peptidase II